ARARVANALGATGESFEPADEELPPPAPLPTVTTSIDEAIANRPELRALEYQQEILGQTLRATKAKQRPRIDAITGVNTRGQFLPTAGQDPYARFNWHIGLVVQVPVFQGMRVRREKEEIQAQIRALESQHRAVREAVMLEVRQAVAFVAAADEAERASQEQVEAAKVALEVSQGRYRAGLGTLIELTDAQAAYVTARSQLVQQRYQRHLARAALGLAMGSTSSMSEAAAKATAGR
ncbi:MAG: TolC family protein, partial [Myxococcales bacterium]|nr:TolC family protein [Myxococcales bacterium]